MRKEPFRAWLAKSHSQKATTNRVSRAGRVERGLAVLGLPFKSLDDAYTTDRLEAVLTALRNTAAEAKAGTRPPLPLVQTSVQPEKQMLSLMNAIQNYIRFRDHVAGVGAGSWPELEQMKIEFLERAADFEDFGQTDGTYWRLERGYKDVMIDQARSLVRSELDDAACGHQLYDALCPSSGPPLRWQTIDAFNKLNPDFGQRFDRALGRLARDEGPITVAIVRAAIELQALRDQGANALTPGEVLAITFTIAAAVRPSESSFFKILKGRQLVDRLGEPPLFQSASISSADVQAWLAILARIFVVMRDEWHWQPRDLLDVQGFAWAVLDPRWGEDFEDAENDEPQDSPQQEMSMNPTNLILYGPPGTGKTFTTAREAVILCDGDADFPETDEGRLALLARYRELENEKRIAFVTFHQNYDYESFVEGLRPETSADENPQAGFRLEAKPGIFREMCALADQARTRTRADGNRSSLDLTGRRFWKMGQGAIGTEDDVYEEALANSYVALGWGGTIDWAAERFTSFDAIKAEWFQLNPDDQTPSNWTQMYPFRCEMKPGDIVIVPYGNTAFRAVAEVTGDYYYVPAAEGYYAHRRAVRWLLMLDDPLPLDTIVEGNFAMRTLYPLPGRRVNVAALGRLLADDEHAYDIGQSPAAPEQFVLIIDEINRANISKVFGELITLLEPDKRLGMPNALTATLPYSKKKDFGVPANLHIVGTMNTADRSIALLDTALRRRFVFRELAPDSSLLPPDRDGIPLRRVLETINDRIEYMIDRDHRIGHAFFLSDGGVSRTAIDATMRDKVIPLLQEYFFEDWSRVAAVLGEPPGRGGGFLDCRKLDDPTGQDGEPRLSWSVRRAFSDQAYDRLVGLASLPGPMPDETVE